MSSILKRLQYKAKKKYIIHIDGDNFFASCELARFPHLKNKAVVVGRERGIAVAYNSHAKALGVTRAMPIHQIQKQFPQVVILQSHFELYKTFSKRIFDIASKHMDKVSLYSIDEVFCEYTMSADVVSEMKKVQNEIYTKLGITVSIGIAKTKVLAKLATSVQKPNGCTLISETNRKVILSETPIENIWGIGRAGTDKWIKRGIVTALDFVNIKEVDMLREYTPTRELYYELLGIQKMSIDNSKSDIQQSFQSTESFPKTNERAFLFSEISRHVEILGARILRAGLYAKNIDFYIKDQDLKYHTGQIKLKNLTQDTSLILDNLEKLFDNIYNQKIYYKSTGVTFTSVSTDTDDKAQSGLFDDLEEENEPRVNTSLEALKATIRAKNGPRSIYNASSSISLRRKADKRTELSKTDPYIYGLPLPYLGIAN